MIDGKTVFELYDTFGFPVDLTGLIARENGFSIDEEGFTAEMQKQKDRSRKASASQTGDWTELQPHEGSTFTGYDSLQENAQLTRYRTVATKDKKIHQFVLDRTPFYGESGGQIGDTGLITLANGERIPVIDTKKENDLTVHYTKKDLAEFLKDGQNGVNAQVNEARREQIAGHHTATHLLHAALRDILGTHVEQKGSLVSDKLLRFDFSHFSKVTSEELEQVEKQVNQKIRENISLDEQRSIPIEEAKKRGAMALFGEKYGDQVRVITFGPDYSVELCGGTHIPATGSLGYFKILSESSVAAGIRRIEAVAGPKAEEYIKTTESELQKVAELLKETKNIEKAVQKLIDQNAGLLSKVADFEKQQKATLKKHLQQNKTEKEGITYIFEQIEAANTEMVRQLAFELKNETDSLVLVLAANIEGKPQVAVMVAEELVEKNGIDARKIIKELAREIKGGGGGQAFFATAGGKDVSGLSKVIEKAKQVLM